MRENKVLIASWCTNGSNYDSWFINPNQKDTMWVSGLVVLWVSLYVFKSHIYPQVLLGRNLVLHLRLDLPFRFSSVTLNPLQGQTVHGFTSIAVTQSSLLHFFRVLLFICAPAKHLEAFTFLVVEKPYLRKYFHMTSSNIVWVTYPACRFRWSNGRQQWNDDNLLVSARPRPRPRPSNQGWYLIRPAADMGRGFFVLDMGNNDLIHQIWWFTQTLIKLLADAWSMVQ